MFFLVLSWISEVGWDFLNMKIGNPFVEKIDNYSGTRCSELKSDHRENYIPRGHFLTDEPTIDNQRENPPKTERILWSLKNQNTSRSCVLTQMRNFALYRHFHSLDVFVTDFPNTSPWMLTTTTRERVSILGFHAHLRQLLMCRITLRPWSIMASQWNCISQPHIGLRCCAPLMCWYVRY